MGANQSVTIKGRKLRIIKQLAEGGFGFVFVAKDLQTKQLFALKQIRCSIQEQIRDAEWEIQVLDQYMNDITDIKHVVTGSSEG